MDAKCPGRSRGGDLEELGTYLGWGAASREAGGGLVPGEAAPPQKPAQSGRGVGERERERVSVDFRRERERVCLAAEEMVRVSEFLPFILAFLGDDSVKIVGLFCKNRRPVFLKIVGQDSIFGRRHSSL